MRVFKSVVNFKDQKRNTKVAGLLAACEVESIDHEKVSESDLAKLIVLTDKVDILEERPDFSQAAERVLFVPDTEIEMLKELQHQVQHFNHVIVVRTEPPTDFPADKVISIVNAARHGGLTLLDHMNRGAAVREFELSASEQRAWFREELTSYIDRFMGALPRPSPIYSQYATEIQDELLMNAIWDASPERAHSSRKEKVFLSPNESIKVKWAFDGFKFGISVRDRFGSFPPELYRKYILSLFSADPRTGIEMQQDGGGAGLGIFMILARASEVTINVCKGKFTDVVVILNFSAGPKAMSKGTKTFQFFNLGDFG